MVEGGGGGPSDTNAVQRPQLVVDGNAGDTVNLDGWTSAGTVSNNGHTYDIYNQGLYAQLLVAQNLMPIGPS